MSVNMASLYKPFTILKCKFSFYCVHSSYILLRKHKFGESQAPFRSLHPLGSTTHAAGSVTSVSFRDYKMVLSL